MEVQTNKRMQLYLFLVKALFVLIVILNVTLSVYEENWFHPTLFGVIDSLVWFYGVLCAHGYFKKPITDIKSEGIIEYEMKVPFVQVAILRIIQFTYSVLAVSSKTKYLNLLILIGCDIIYTVFLLMFKSSYYYISAPIDDDDDVNN